MPAAYAALAAVFLVVYRFFYAAEVSYRQSLAVVAWTAAAFRLVTTPLVLLVMSLRGDWNVDPQEALQASPAALLDRATTPPALFAVAETLDLFSLWVIALLSIGYAAVIGSPRRSGGLGGRGAVGPVRDRKGWIGGPLLTSGKMAFLPSAPVRP